MQRDLTEIRDLYVRPYYLHLLHGNFAWRSEEVLFRQLLSAAPQIDGETIEMLLATREWRGRLVAAWVVGIAAHHEFLSAVGELLLASELCYSGQGYCVALALLAGPNAESYLETYLLEYLPLGDRYYDQTWAIGALAYSRFDRAERFLRPELWSGKAQALDYTAAIAEFRELMRLLNAWGISAERPNSR